MAQSNKIDEDKELRQSFNWVHLKRLLGYIEPHKKRFALSLVLMMIASLAGLTGPLLMKEAIDKAIPYKNTAYLVFIAGCFLAAIIVSALCSRYKTLHMSHTGNEIVRQMRKDIFSQLQNLSFHFFDNRPHGKIMIRVVHYVNSVSDLISNGLINAISEIFSLFFLTGFMFALNVKLSLLALAGLPLLVTAIFAMQKLQKRMWQEASRKNSNMVAYLAESINGMQVTQSFNRQDRNAQIFQKLNTDYRRQWAKAAMVSSAVWPLIENINFLSVALVYIGGIALFVEGVTVGLLVAFVGYVGRFWGPINTISNFYNSLVQTAAYVERVFETIDEPVYVHDRPKSVILPPVKGFVEFENVSFRYDDEASLREFHNAGQLRKEALQQAATAGPMVLQNISFKVAAGQMAAIVGETGSGKTTIVNLIPRFYDIHAGEIKIDNYNIANVRLDSLRRQIGFMLQDSFLFSGTIRDNIRYGRLDAADEEIEAAARAVCAHQFIQKLPEGYDSLVIERGRNLSMGQQQLISFARALLADPKILILDEATSNIDSETEEQLQQGLKMLLRGRTSFVIAHRLSTIRDADIIFYVNRGFIVESGSHEELMAARGFYWRQVTGAR